jgi:putative transposase
MTYWRLFYHVVWATHDREPLIHPGLSQDLWRVIVGKATEQGALVYAVGGIEDHVHVVASVPPRLALSDFVAQLKGNSSHFVNHVMPLEQPFAWRTEYGIVSFDGKQLDRVVTYISNQPQHHLNGTTIPIFENVAAEDARSQTR